MSAAVHAQNALFSPVISAADSGAKTDLVARIAARPTTKSLDLVRIDLTALQSDAVVLSLRDGDAVVNKRETEVRGADDYTWVGTFPVGGSVILVVMNGEIGGQIRKGFDQYSIRHVGNGVHAVFGIDNSKFGPDEPTVDGSIRLNRFDSVPTGSQLGPNWQTDGSVQVDVFVPYTTAAKAAYGSSISALAQQAVKSANEAYSFSNTNVVMRLVGTLEITYVESGKTAEQILNDLVSGGDAQMVAARTMRDAVGADLVGLIVNIPGGICGRAAEIKSSAANAYMIVDPECALDNYSFQHEFGHLFGARHDPFVDESVTPFVYGHGYIAPGNPAPWRTVMAYENGCGSCPRLNFFSNPQVSYNGIATGTYYRHDNARVHRERVSTVAAFRSTVAVPATKPSHDFDGDGKGDILLRNSMGDISMWLMNGGSASTVASLGNVSNNWTIVGQRDFSSTPDAKSDLVWLDTAGDVGFWFMNGGTTVSPIVLGNVGTSWSVVGTGDFDGVGKADILWRNTSGEVGIWFMNGGTLASTAGLGNVGPTWQVQNTASN